MKTYTKDSYEAPQAVLVIITPKTIVCLSPDDIDGERLDYPDGGDIIW